MASEMGVKIGLVFCLCLLGTANAEVTLKGEWKENFGWRITCSWQTMANDTLQSLRMFRNGNQFLVYRPELHAMQHVESSSSEQFLMATECRVTSSPPQTNGQKGRCVVNLEYYQNSTEDTYLCETSGERPTFRQEVQEYSAYVPPSAAIVKQIETESNANLILRPTVNCTSSGLPPPRLLWTVEGRKIPEDFTHTKWNSTTKLWDSWSSYNPQEYNMVVMCTPETSRAGRLDWGVATQWVVAYNGTRGDTPIFIVIYFAILALFIR